MWKWTTLSSFKWSDSTSDSHCSLRCGTKRKINGVKGQRCSSSLILNIEVNEAGVKAAPSSQCFVICVAVSVDERKHDLGWVYIQCPGSSELGILLRVVGLRSESGFPWGVLPVGKPKRKCRERDTVTYLYQWQMVQKFRDTRLDPGVLPTRNPGLWTIKVLLMQYIVQ